LIDQKKLDKIDKEKMYQIYDTWPEIAEKSYNKKFAATEFGEIDHIVFAGMGGSGALGDIFASILSKKDIHVRVVKGYHLPKTVDSNTLVIVTSVSGNTVEALNILEQVNKINCKCIGFSSGGIMEEFCIKNNIEYRKIPQIHSPRASFSTFLFSMLKILGPTLSIDENHILESISELKKLKNKINTSNLTESNESLSISNWIEGIPLIYYPVGLEAAAIRFKNSLQENTKIHAITENVIEACHNGIVSWEKNSNVQPILLQGKDDHFKTKERWVILKEYFNKKGIAYKEINSIDGNILSKIICLIYLCDYTSIYLSVVRDIDPSPVESIAFIKKRI